MKLIPNYLVSAELCRRSFYFFVKEFWNVIISETAVYNWHIEYLCNELQRMVERIKARLPKEYDLIINIPPGTTKSTICTIMLPVWCWASDPTTKIITGSYSDNLSTHHAVKSRDIIRSDKFKQYFPEIELKFDSDNKTAYENNFNGARYSTSVGGTITGKHGHLIIVDDPINPKKANSQVERESAVKWMDETLSTRKIDKEVTPTILVMQRLHEEDPTGHILKKSDKLVKHICLPAEVGDNVNPPELKEKYVDGLLDPIRLSRKALQELRTDLGSYGYAGQMEQKPNPDDGGILKDYWFTTISQDEFKKIAENKLFVWDFFIDGAYTNKTKNDPSALMCVAKIGDNAYIKQSKQVWLEFPELIKEIGSFVNANDYSRASRIFVEPKATGLSIVQSIRKQTYLNVVELEAPKDDKVTRVTSVSPIVEAKRVFILKGDWNKAFTEECKSFPNGKHDDQVDNLSAMLNKYFAKKTSFAAPKITLFNR